MVVRHTVPWGRGRAVMAEAGVVVEDDVPDGAVWMGGPGGAVTRSIQEAGLILEGGITDTSSHISLNTDTYH